MIITIDGPAGSGKSTTAELVAQKLGFIHFNSGSLYRGIAAFALENNLSEKELIKKIDKNEVTLQTKFKGKQQHVIVNGVDYYSRLRLNEVSINSAKVSVYKQVRNIIDACQKKFCYSHNIVIEGRDTGSFVFPDAEYKFYLDCSVKERARRRYLEEKEKNPSITITKIEKELRERDKLDKSREIAPLVVPKNAIKIDSSSLSIEETAQELLKHITTAT